MKRNVWALMILTVVVLGLLLGVALLFVPNENFSDALRRGKIKEMTEYLNEKYGYEITDADCIYFREEDHSGHGDALGFGRTYDVPHIAVFDYQGKKITVTNRDGFLGDDNQLKELSELLSTHFSQSTGLETAFVEVRNSNNGDIKDEMLNQLLHHSFNEKLSQANIEQFVQLMLNRKDLELIFYYYPQENIHAQIEQITTALYPLSEHSNLEQLRFYILADENLQVYYTQPWVMTQTEEENLAESDESYIWGHYHVPNDVEYFYLTGSSSYYQDVKFNRFLAGGFCKLDRGYSGGFGDREVQTVNNFGVVDLSGDQLEEYLQEMTSYGEYNGCTILFRAGEGGDLSKQIIKDGNLREWVFHWGSGPLELYVFKYGSLTELQTAYDKGYLSSVDMDRILQAHKNHFYPKHTWNYEIEPDELSTELRTKILEYFYDEFGMTFSGKYDDPDTIGLLQYYGTFSDYVIFMQAGAGCAISEVEIGGRMFRWGMYPLVFYAYRNGETFTLQEVYEAGNITEEDLDTILQRHKEYFATVHHWNYDTP